MKTIKRYSELIRLNSFEERFRYLKMGGIVGESTFGFDRYLNQSFYRSKEWRAVRNKIIVRDAGFDMGHNEYPIGGRIIVHHINPICMEDLEEGNPDILNPEFLICVSELTHNAIHYGDFDLLPGLPVERKPFDTCPWKG